MSHKQMMDESFAIDEEWKRIDKERNSFKVVDDELNKENEANNAKVRELNSKGGATAEESRDLKERQTAFDKKEALLTERKARLLYDIEEVNKRSHNFNDKFLKSGVEPKTIKTIKMSVNGEQLAPKPYKKGEPLKGDSARASSPAGGSPKTRSFAVGSKKLEGGKLADESKAIDQEWARIEKEKTRIKAEDKRMDEDMEKFNKRVTEVNAMKSNQRGPAAELDAWQKRLDKDEAASIESKRHLLYDIEQVNNRKRAFNDSIQGTDLGPKNVESLTYLQNDEKLTPLPYTRK